MRLKIHIVFCVCCTTCPPRLFSQIRKGAPLHEEWHEAFACGRFHQRQGRATLTTPLTGQHAYMFAQHRLNADVVRGEPGYPAPKSSPNDNADPDLKSASHGLAQISSKPHKRYRDDDEGDDEDSNEDSKSDPAFALLMLGAASSEAALLMLGAASSEAALPVPAKNSKRRREGQGAGSKRGSSHASLSVTQAELQAQIQRQLQQQQIHLQAHMQQELQRVQEHMQIEFQQHIQRITGLTSGQGFPGAGGGLSPFLPLYGQAMVQATSPGTVSNFHNPTSSVAPFTSVNEQSISDTGHSGLDFISRSANRDTQSLSSAELHRVKSSAVATAAAAAAMAGATDMTQPAALATLLTGKLMSADGDNSSSNLSLPLVQALAGEAPPDWTATLALAALAKQNTATELHLGPLASNPPESP